jgi:hypothetical protein
MWIPGQYGQKGNQAQGNAFLYARTASSALAMRAIPAISLYDKWVFALSIYQFFLLTKVSYYEILFPKKLLLPPR